MFLNEDSFRRPADLHHSPPCRRGWRTLLLCGLSVATVGALGCSVTPKRVTQPSKHQAAKPTSTESHFAWENVGGRGDAGVGRLANATDGKTSGADRDIRLTSGSNNPANYPIPSGLGRMPDDKPLSGALKSVQSAPQGSSAAQPLLQPTPRPMDALSMPPAAAAPVEVLGDMAHEAPLISGVGCGDCAGGCGFTRNWGVSCDRCGWLDNFSVRIGGTVSGLNNASTLGGVLGILENSAQLRTSNVFLHSGVATEWLDDRWPVAFTAGFSRLARLRNNQVLDPWIFAFTYDGYWDDGMFGLNDTVYMDQVRVLAGYAVLPRLDVGAWGAIGLRRDNALFTSAPVGGVITQISATRRFADRVAGYFSFDLNDHGAQVIGSLGYEESPGYMFAEIDGFFPIRRNVNLFAGLGYSTVGSFDAVVGLEFLYGLATKQRRPCPVGWGNADCKSVAVADFHERYRGGWANGTYRSALRVVTPSRVRRSMDVNIGDPQRVVVPGVQDDPPSTGPTPTPTPKPEPKPDPKPNPKPNPKPDPKPDPKPNPPCPPRLENRTQREGRLSQWLKANAKECNTCDPQSFQPHRDLPKAK